jgi:hypothetical protein
MYLKDMISSSDSWKIGTWRSHDIAFKSSLKLVSTTHYVQQLGWYFFKPCIWESLVPQGCQDLMNDLELCSLITNVFLWGWILRWLHCYAMCCDPFNSLESSHVTPQFHIQESELVPMVLCDLASISTPAIGNPSNDSVINEPQVRYQVFTLVTQPVNLSPSPT